MPCSKGAEQTICVKPEALDTECPITDVLLVLKENVDTTNLKDYTLAKISPNQSLSWSLYYSKR